MVAKHNQVPTITPTVDQRIASELEHTVQVSQTLLCEMESSLEAMRHLLSRFDGDVDDIMTFKLQAYALKSRAEKLVLSAHFVSKLVGIKSGTNGD